MDIYTLLDKYRANADNNRAQGEKFERLIKAYLLTDSLYSGDNAFTDVWLWGEFPYRGQFGGQDTGIDIAARTAAGAWWAVQCKFYTSGATVSKEDVDSFLSTSSRTFIAKTDNGEERVAFSERYIIYTGRETWGRNAEEAIANQKPPVNRITLNDLAVSNADWGKLDAGLYGEAARLPQYTPKDYQREAIDAAARYYEKHERGKLIMACGTGKTFTSLRIAERITGEKGLVLFLVPSLALVNQTLREWYSQAIKPFTGICVCSDPKVSKSEEENDAGGTKLTELALPATTDAHTLAERLAPPVTVDSDGDRKAHFTVVFSTYQSIDVVAQAQRIVNSGKLQMASSDAQDTNHSSLATNHCVFDLIIADEAHRTTGITLLNKGDGDFVRVHDNSFIKARHRMYMTATPRIYSDSSKTKAQIAQAALFSMDNEALYGGEIYKIGFSEAVRRNLLSPYKVVIFTVSESNIPPAILEKIAAQKGTIGAVNRQLTMDEAARLIGSVCALSKQVIGDNEIIAKDDPAKMKRAVAFLPRIKDSKYIAEQFPIVANDYVNALKDVSKREAMVHLAAEHIDGTMDALEKGRRIEWLKGVGSRQWVVSSKNSDEEDNTTHYSLPTNHYNECRVLCNVRCLSEGVDVPSLDAVIFLSTKSSQLEVIQAVGRVMRRAAGKKYGYIIIPVYVPQKQDAIDALDQTKEYEIVWAVLNALKSHDEAFSQIVDKIALLNMKVNNGIISVVVPEVRFGKKSPKRKGGGGGGGDDTGGEDVDLALDYELQDVQDYIFSRIVDKVSDKFFLQAWAHEVAEIAQAHIARINAMLDYDESGELYAEFDKTSAESAAYQKRSEALRSQFDKFLDGLHHNINGTIARQQAVEMLSQHIITAPIFDALFGNTDFTRYNPISRSMEEMLFAIRQNGLDRTDEATAAKLKGFYDNIKDHISHLDNAEAKQKVIVKLYDNFFKIAFPKMAKTMGIVYTPVEVVDFIIHSVNAVIRRDFGRSLSDEGVNVIDPFTGTGTFITRLLQSGIIGAADMERKYTSELFANEIVLLAYYIAAANIESAFSAASDEWQVESVKAAQKGDECGAGGGQAISDEPGAGEDKLTTNHLPLATTYKQFAGICLTDTFELFERGTEEQLPYDFLKENSERLERQKNAPIRVIVGNPPYSVGQRNANDNAQNLHYPKLEGEIARTYVEKSDAALNKGLYDSYVKAFKWATLRLGEAGGVIGFVTNAGWIDANGMDGMRKCFAEDFSDIYVFNLRGNCRTSGELRRQEGDNIFNQGSRAAIAISILVKNPKQSGCRIHYYAVDDYMTREEKLELLSKLGGIDNPAIKWQEITPNSRGDWINQRADVFDTLAPLAPEKKEDEAARAVFSTYAIGIAAGRDTWVYGYCKSKTADNMKRMIAEYKRQRKEKQITMDSTKISWTRALKRDFANNTEHSFNNGAFRTVMYRPFCKELLYYDKPFIESPGIWSRLFPAPDTENLVICVEGVGSSKDFGCLMADMLSDFGYAGIHSQCFPLYYYTEEGALKKGERDLPYDDTNHLPLTTSHYTRHDGVSDWILHKAREKYSDGDGDGKRGSVITKDDIFYYVYGFLHSPDYREKFKADLKKSLPRIPLVERAENFWAFSRAGRELAELHLHYEEYGDSDGDSDGVRVIGAECGDYTVQKMRWQDKDKKDVLIYNSKIRVEGIPPEVHEYVVNGRSALGWVMERYQVKTDKDSGITNDPNDWAREQGKPRYILDLVLSVIEVSVRTVRIVRGLPRVRECAE